MYNLEIAQDHTFTVGEGEWIVHNCAVGPTSGNEDPTDNVTMQDILNDPWILEDKHMTPEEVELIAARDGWVQGKLLHGTHEGQGYTWRVRNDADTDFTDKFVEWHPGGGRHGPEPYWKVSSGPGGKVRVGPQFERPSTGSDTTEGDFTEGDFPDFSIDP